MNKISVHMHQRKDYVEFEHIPSHTKIQDHTNVWTGICYGNVIFDNKRFRIITSNASEESLSQLTAQIGSLSPAEKKELSQILYKKKGTSIFSQTFSKQDRCYVWWEFDSLISDIQFNLASPAQKKEILLKKTKKQIEDLTHAHERKLKELDHEKMHVPSLFYSFPKEESDAYFEKYLAKMISTNQMKVSPSDDFRLGHFIDAVNSVLLNKDHKYHKVVVNILKEHKVTNEAGVLFKDSLAYARINYLSDSMLRYAGVLPSIEDTKQKLTEEFLQKKERLEEELLRIENLRSFSLTTQPDK